LANHPWQNKISNAAQVGGIETSVLDNGAGRGTRIAWVNTGTGLRYKVVLDRAMDIVPAILQAVQLRLRPIVMTSLAFILGVLPLAFSSGAGAQARSTIGWTVLGGMLGATILAIFIVPVLFVLISRLAYSSEKLEQLRQKAELDNDVT